MDPQFDAGLAGAGAPAGTARPFPDQVARRVLRVPNAQVVIGEPEMRQAFSRSLAISAVRCLLTYVILPFLAPLAGWASDVGPIPGLLIGLVAIGFNVRTIRRFWMADHQWRWAYTAISGSVIALLLVLMVEDISSLL